VQFLAIQKFHRDIGQIAGFAQVVDGHDRRVAQGTGGLRFLLEARLVLAP
jgi:hypothetical protein